MRGIEGIRISGYQVAGEQENRASGDQEVVSGCWMLDGGG